MTQCQSAQLEHREKAMKPRHIDVMTSDFRNFPVEAASIRKVAARVGITGVF